ncbi:MAG: fibronectin type III domain-containing protein [SAR202 cluster bacterium]|nr:fibronectin type III domain-containing protein [SAR202 cluster bacterium]
MVAGRRTPVFGSKAEIHKAIIITGKSNGTQRATVSIKITSDQASPSTIYSGPAKYSIPIDPPCTENSVDFLLLVDTPMGLPEPPATPFQFPAKGPYEIHAQVLREDGSKSGVADIVVRGNVVEIPPLRVNYFPAYIGSTDMEFARRLEIRGVVQRAAQALRQATDRDLPIFFPLKSTGGVVTTLRSTVDLNPVLNPPQTWGEWFSDKTRIGALSATQQHDLRMSRINDYFTTGAALTEPAGAQTRYIVVLQKPDLYAVWGSDGINGFSNHKGAMVHSDVVFRTVAHEIAHTTGRTSDSEGWLFSRDEMQRDCSLNYHNEAMEIAHGVRIAADNSRAILKDQYHMMVSVVDNPPWWISQCTYWHLVHRLQERLDPPVIQVRGHLSRTESANGAALLPSYRMDGVIDLNEGPGEWAILLKDDGGNLLGSFPFTPTWRLETHGDDQVLQVRDLVITSFGYQVPDLPGTARIEIQGPGNQVLDSIAYTAAAPSVRVSAPAAGSTVEPVDGAVNIQWSGSDPDGGDLLYTVLYSSDGGENWSMLSLEGEATEFAVTLDPEETDHVVKVVATDGANSGQAEVTFTTKPAGGSGFSAMIIALAALVVLGAVGGGFFLMKKRRA